MQVVTLMAVGTSTKGTHYLDSQDHIHLIARIEYRPPPQMYTAHILLAPQKDIVCDGSPALTLIRAVGQLPARPDVIRAVISPALRFVLPVPQVGVQRELDRLRASRIECNLRRVKEQQHNT